MTQLPTRELERTEDRRSKTLGQIVAVATNPHLIAAVIFFLTGCWLAANLLLRFPDLGLTVEQFNPFAGP
jgi:hypothetical protein